MLPRLQKVSPAVYPHLNHFNGDPNFRYLRRPTLNKNKNISVELPSSPINVEANPSRGSRAMIGQTNRQTDISTLYRYITQISDLKEYHLQFLIYIV